MLEDLKASARQPAEVARQLAGCRAVLGAHDGLGLLGLLRQCVWRGRALGGQALEGFVLLRNPGLCLGPDSPSQHVGVREEARLAHGRWPLTPHHRGAPIPVYGAQRKAGRAGFVEGRKQERAGCIGSGPCRRRRDAGRRGGRACEAGAAARRDDGSGGAAGIS
eukprot:scaffold2616_cov106-Isochrysis_galbana.AAC.2